MITGNCLQEKQESGFMNEHVTETVSDESPIEYFRIGPQQMMSCGASGWVQDKTDGERVQSVNPTTGEVLATVMMANQDSHQRVMEEAKEAFKKWSVVPAPKRGEVVRLLGEALREHKQQLGRLVSLEMGKSLQEGLGEVQEMIDMADLAVGQSRMLYGKTMHSERPSHRMYEQWHPLGVVAVITAFNFPVAVWAWNAMVAAIAGNVVVWKPSIKTPLTAIAVQNICNHVMKASGHEGVFSLSMVANEHVDPWLVSDPQVPLVSFTGSTEVGRSVATSVAKRLGRSLLELSGNNASIVCADANLDLVIPAVVFGAVGTSGQRCTTLRRLYVHDDLYDQVLARLKDAYRQINVGDPLEDGVLVGPVIDQGAIDQYLKTVQEIKNLDGRIVSGGSIINRAGFFVEPCLVEADASWPLLREETFVPILFVVRCKSVKEAIELNNSSHHGLSSSIFSNDLKACEHFLSAAGSDCGLANVNMGPSGAEIGGAFGGEKDTGGGREAGSDAWKAYMRRQTCAINWGDDLPLAQGISFGVEADE